MTASRYGRKCAVCGGPLGPQCFGGCWSNDVVDWLEGKIPPTAIRESCQYCILGPPTFMYGKEVHDAILERRRRRCEEQITK